jgi:hypothetical protein
MPNSTCAAASSRSSFTTWSGYYNRFDVFDLTINRKRLVPATFVDKIDDEGVAFEPAERAV